jgi:lantibiotic leader peptide-processing serine protease
MGDAPTSEARQSSTTTEPVGSYLVLYRSPEVPGDVEDALAAADGTLVASVDSLGLVWATSSAPDFVARISADPRVIAVDDLTGVVVELGDDAATELEGPDDSLISSPSLLEEPGLLLSAPTGDDVFFPFQWNLQRINAPQAWTIHTGSHDTVVVIMDTGVASNHPDLAPNLLYRTCFSGTANPCRPYPDATAVGTRSFHGTAVAGLIAAGFGGGKGSGSPLPPLFRTTGGGGTVGVAPNLGLASYKFGPEQGCEDPQSCLATLIANLQAWEDVRIRHAQGVPLDVINMSFSWFTVRQAAGGHLGKSCSDLHSLFLAMQRALTRLDQEGITLVAAAGNDALNVLGVQMGSANADNPLCSVDADQRIVRFTLAAQPGVITVGAAGIRPRASFVGDTIVFAPERDELTDYSNFGAAVDLVAPSGHAQQLCAEDYAPAPCPIPIPDIYRYHTLITARVLVTTACAATESCTTFQQVGFSGTSGAAPHISAVAGLIIDKAKKDGVRLTPAQVKSILLQTARPLGDRQRYGHGMVDAYAALQKVNEMTRGIIPH